MQELFPVNGKKRTANAVRDEFPPVGNAGDGVPYVQVSFCLQWLSLHQPMPHMTSTSAHSSHA